MDSLTHIVIGGIAGEIVLGKRVGNRAVMWGGLIGTIPDLDVFVAPFLSPVDALFFHRGISHSLLTAFILIPILGWVLSKIEKRQKIEFKQWVGLVAFPWVLHLFTDCFNTYGTGLFEPFSKVRISYDSMAIVDVFLLLPLIIALVWILLLPSQKNIRRIISWAGFGFILFYVTLSVFNKKHIETQVISQLKSQQIKYNRLITTPVPLSNLFWGIVAEDDSGYFVGNVSNFNETRSIDFNFIPRNSNLLTAFSENKAIPKLLRFTKGFYAVECDSLNNTWVHDLRYASLDFKNPNAYVFSFKIVIKDNNIEVSRSHPKRRINFKTIRKYSKRGLLK